MKRPAPPKGLRLSTLAIWLAGLALSVVAGYLTADRNADILRQRFVLAAEDLSGGIKEKISLYQYGLRSARGAIISGGGLDITRRQFEAYEDTRDLGTEFPGARGFGFVQTVAPQDLPRFIQSAKADGYPDFALRQLAPHDGDLMIIRYIYPLEPNKGATGLDIASEENRRTAAMAAAESGEARLTKPITLVQASGQQKRGFLFLMPVYRPGADLSTTSARLEALLGWSYAAIVIDEVLASLRNEMRLLTVTLTDGDSQTQFYQSSSIERSQQVGPSFRWRNDLELFGRTWRVDIEAREEFLADQHLVDPYAIGAVGAALATILAVLFHVFAMARHRRREASVESERMTASIIDASPQALLVIDENGVIVRANRMARDLFGHAGDEIIGADIATLIAADQRAELATQFRLLDRADDPLAGSVTGQMRGPGGATFWAVIQLSLLEMRTGRYVVAGVRDITVERQARALLEESEQSWQELANSLPQLIWTCDGNGHCDFLSRQWVTYTGLDPEQHYGPGWGEQVHPEDRDRIETTWQEAMAASRPFICEFRIRRHDGIYRWFDTRAEPLIEDGKVLRWFGSNTDIDDRRQAETQVRQLLQDMEHQVEVRTRELTYAQEDLQNIVDAIPSMIGYWNQDQTNRFANRAYKAWFGVDGDEIKGKPMRAVLGDRVYEMNLPFIQAALAGEAQRFERELVVSEGVVRHVQAHYIPDIRFGEVIGFYVLVFDITELKQSEIALKEAKITAENATRAKSIFLTSMSHELRTPMNGIIGFTDLLLSQRFGALTDKQLEFTEVIKKSGDHLLKLMDDVLELSKIESGSMALSVESVDVTTLMHSVVAGLRPMAEQNAIRLLDSHKGQKVPDVLADKTRLRQSLINLGSNAIKYNRAGGFVEFAVRTETPDVIRFTVADNGVGIADDRQMEVFQPFNRLGAEQGSIEGTGIGLSLVRKLVELMGGTVGFTSEKGAGSTFWIDLPVAGRQPDDVAEATVVDEAREMPSLTVGTRVLYVEDNDQNRFLMRNYMSLLPQVDLLEARDGVEGLAIALSRHPNLIIVDINIPGMDGYTLLRKLREKPELARVPIMALTANAMSGDVERGLAAGFDRYLTKPARLNEIMDAMQELLGVGVEAPQ